MECELIISGWPVQPAAVVRDAGMRDAVVRDRDGARTRWCAKAAVRERGQARYGALSPLR